MTKYIQLEKETSDGSCHDFTNQFIFNQEILFSG